MTRRTRQEAEFQARAEKAEFEVRELRAEVERLQAALAASRQHDGDLIRRLRAEVERLQAAARKASDELDDIADYAGSIAVANEVRGVAQDLRTASSPQTPRSDPMFSDSQDPQYHIVTTEETT